MSDNSDAMSEMIDLLRQARKLCEIVNDPVVGYLLEMALDQAMLTEVYGSENDKLYC